MPAMYRRQSCTSGTIEGETTTHLATQLLQQLFDFSAPFFLVNMPDVGPKRRRAAEGRPIPTKRRVVRKKRPAIKKQERKVNEARRRLMHAEAALAAEELPDLTGNR